MRSLWDKSSDSRQGSPNSAVSERSPLIRRTPRNDEEDVVPKPDALQHSIGEEALILLRAAIPTSAGYLLQNSIQLASVTIIGWLGPLELSIAASGFMIAVCSAWLLAIGGTTALDTLGSRSAAENDGKHTSLAHLVQLCFLVMTVLYVPIVILWCFIGPILVLCGQSHELSYGTQTFLRLLAPGGLGYIYFETLKKYLQCQDIRVPGVAVLAFVSLANVPVCWTVVHKMHLGLSGAVLTTGGMYWAAFLLLLGYALLNRDRCSWEKPSYALFADVRMFVKLVLLGIVMVGAEWWGFELIAVAAGVLGDVPVAAQSILMTVDTVFALVPFGLGVASTNRVASLLGHGRKEQACVAALASSCLAIANGCITMTLILTCRRFISSQFSDDSDVVALAVATFPWGAAFQVVDSLQAANSGCLRGMGRADIGAGFNLFAYYVIAIPLGLITGFYFGWQLHGLWFGLATALAIVGIGEFSLVNFVSWDRYVDYATAEAAAVED